MHVQILKEAFHHIIDFSITSRKKAKQKLIAHMDARKVQQACKDVYRHYKREDDEPRGKADKASLAIEILLGGTPA